MLTANIELVGKTVGTLNRDAPTLSLPLPPGARYGDSVITILGGSSLYRNPGISVGSRLRLLPSKFTNIHLSQFLNVIVAVGTVGDITQPYSYTLMGSTPTDLHVCQLIYRGVEVSVIERITETSSFVNDTFSYNTPPVRLLGERAVVLSGLVTKETPGMSFAAETTIRELDESEVGMYLCDQVQYRTSRTPPIQIRTNTVQPGLTFSLILPSKLYLFSQLIRVMNVSEQLQTLLLADGTSTHIYPGESRDLNSHIISDDIRRLLALGLIRAYNPETGVEIV